jgi:hypothetical protein
MQRVEMQSDVRPGVVPSSLAHKFDVTDDVEFYADASLSRYVGLCKARKFFAAWKPEAITTGELDKSYATLQSF